MRKISLEDLVQIRKIRNSSSMNGGGLICFDKSNNENLTFPSEANLLQLPTHARANVITS